MNVKYVDTHCHLQFEQYAHDREEIIEKMRKEGIAAIVVGTDLETSKEAVALAEKYEHLFASIGFHPGNTTLKSFDEAAYRALAENKKVVAIGECGLEYFHTKANDEEKNAQKTLFEKQITIAAELNKPLTVHVRPSKGTHDAYQDLIQILKKAKIKYPNLRGDIHFFAGSITEAEAFFALGFTISFTAVITFSRDYDEIIKAAPLQNILSETDAPYVAPASRRGERNDPLAVIEVVQQIAAIHGENFEDVRTTLLANAKRLFALREA
ncbi:MAG: TatD family hydrolase [Candidatus Kaiserbacteria bacterium]|nr:TatD family hydrolase [Candidatus Kaiserbacteria bacterium]